ncbi:hypothetical protein TNCV_3388281 [Trichonephila clavipes]|nr:hypothetical protein TNCV_3388281 [Trichonephila clavipes]
MWFMVAQRLTLITPQLRHQINFGNVWKLLGLLYPKNPSKVSLNQCRGLSAAKFDKAERESLSFNSKSGTAVPELHRTMSSHSDSDPRRRHLLYASQIHGEKSKVKNRTLRNALADLECVRKSFVRFYFDESSLQEI